LKICINSSRPIDTEKKKGNPNIMLL